MLKSRMLELVPNDNWDTNSNNSYYYQHLKKGIRLHTIMIINEYDDAALIMQKSENGEYSLYTSSLSMVNIAYILRKYYRGESLYHLLEELGDIIGVITVSSEAYHKALQSRALDFEDAIQLFSINLFNLVDSANMAFVI